MDKLPYPASGKWVAKLYCKVWQLAYHKPFMIFSLSDFGLQYEMDIDKV
jgi:hypothetical protein